MVDNIFTRTSAIKRSLPVAVPEWAATPLLEDACRSLISERNGLVALALAGASEQGAATEYIRTLLNVDPEPHHVRERAREMLRESNRWRPSRFLNADVRQRLSTSASERDDADDRGVMAWVYFLVVHVALEMQARHEEAVFAALPPPPSLSERLGRRALQEVATPSWADLAAIKAIYTKARELTEDTGVAHEVDHIVPIKSRLVCGLHVPANLRVITADDNRRKSNRFSTEAASEV